MQSDKAGETAHTDMFTPSQIRLLKIAVVVMGVILLLGFIAVIGRIVHLVNSGPRETGQALPANGQPPSPVALPAGAVVRQLALSGNRLAIYYESPTGAGIRIVDLGSAGSGFTLQVVPGGDGGDKRP